jgi:predicted amidohydrolase
MKVCAIKHKVEENQNFVDYLTKIELALKYAPDIIVGPDYALSYLNESGRIKFSMREEIISKLEKLSHKYPKTIIVPGTTPFALSDLETGHSAMIFHNGKKIYEFRKETCVGDQKIAEKNGRTYVGGCSDNNYFFIGSKKIAVEICSDHGKQQVPLDTFLELILTYDDNAGFWIRANNDDFSRYAIVCDGRAPKVECFKYNHTNPIHKMGILKGQSLNKDISLFELNERNVRYA